MLIITVGKTYIDIDGYASSLAYRELLQLKGIESKFVSNAIINYSVTDSLKRLPYTIDDYNVLQDDKFILIDFSNKDFIPDFVDQNNIIEVIDHHPGFEKYWENILGNGATIVPIGSVATIIVEKYEQENLLIKMDKDIIKLLMAAILDNTVNFTARITNERDKIAFIKLEKMLNDNNFETIYFNERQNYIENNLEESIKNDLKIQNFNKYLPPIFGQLTIRDADKLLLKRNIIDKIMFSYGSKWMLNIISLKDNSSYILYSDEDVKNRLKDILKCREENNALVTTPAMMRKEIMGIECKR